MALIHACTIESGGFVGMNTTIMDEAVVGGGAMVAAGALLTPRKRVPSGELWSGSPAKKMRELTQEERDYIPYSAQNYARLAAEHLRRFG
jgi:carbonic anhydrase/acetyltransferase-like protein (isoleucine patch superfamily)